MEASLERLVWAWGTLLPRQRNVLEIGNTPYGYPTGAEYACIVLLVEVASALDSR
jgi:hypothetical protein